MIDILWVEDLSSKMSNICKFQLLKSKDFLIFFVIYYRKLRVLGFWTVGWMKICNV